MRERIEEILHTNCFLGIAGLKVKQLQPRVISETPDEWKARVGKELLTAIAKDVEEMPLVWNPHGNLKTGVKASQSQQFIAFEEAARAQRDDIARKIRGE